ncbi:MAG: ATP-binding cassette domain-containing protein, partial [Eggerthellaceae bacterium]|nr:ATP-binding cassette domain-containing protein [Eggerthellaceae bacterium]
STVRGVLFGLGFKDADMSRHTSEVSGGWQMRLALAKLLVRNPEVLLLDEGLQTGDFLKLLFLLGLELLDSLLTSAQVGSVITLVQVDLAVVDFGNAVDHVVHERAVMRNDDDRSRVSAQEALQPAHGFQIQMIRRLVEKQPFGIAHQKLRQRQAHLPAARELARVAAHVGFFEAKSEQHPAHLGFDGVAAEYFVVVARATGGG